MTPGEFVARYGSEWDRLDAIIAGGNKAQFATDAAEFPVLYRRVCQHLALAGDRHYPQDILDRLNALALAGQQVLYRPQREMRTRIATFLGGGFARDVRRHPRLLLASLCVFYLPLLLGMFATWQMPELIYSLMPPENVQDVEDMYDSAKRAVIGYHRDDGDNLMMFGYYIANNIGIGFNSFAGGLFAGVGSAFLLFYNGIMIGMIAGFLTARGHSDTFWPFVCGHSAYELNAIVLCGMTGLMLGLALVAPGRYRRRDALVIAGREAIPILYGAAFMLVIAATLEAFWSSRTAIPLPLKYGFAALSWTCVVVYFVFAGREEKSTPGPDSGKPDAP